MDPSSWRLMLICWAVGRLWGGEVGGEQKRLGVPTRTIDSHWPWLHRGPHDNLGKCLWSDIRRRMQNPGCYLGYDQSHIKYVGMWVKTQRRLRKIKIGWLNHTYLPFFPPFSFSFFSLLLYSYLLINIKLGEMRRKKEERKMWVRKNLLSALVRIIYQLYVSEEL